MNIDFKFYAKLMLRRMPAMLLLFLLCTGLSFGLAMTMPTTYSSSARLLVESPQIPSDLASSTVRTSFDEQLRAIEERLLSRANMIDIANRFDVFPDGDRINPDTIVAQMRQNTRISSWGRPMIITVSFNASEPRVAARVVNEYVTAILDSSVELRTRVAGGTLSFFEQEVKRLDRELNEQSGKILAFKEANSDALPDNLSFRQDRQGALQERLLRAQRERDGLAEQRQRFQEIFEQTGQVAGLERQLSPAERRLASVERELEEALIIYSPTNPRVRVLQARLEQMRQAVLAETEAGAATEADLNLAMFEAQLGAFEVQIQSLDQQIADLTNEIDKLQDSIDRTPANRIEVDTLERDYGNLQGQYNAAVQSLAEARMGERIELGAKGQRISIIEEARVPTAPSSPNRPLIVAAGVAAGLAAAAGLFFLLELVNRKVRRPSEITSVLGITPLATISYIESVGQRRLRRSLQFVAIMLVMVGTPGVLWLINEHYMPLDLLARRVVDKINIL